MYKTKVRKIDCIRQRLHVKWTIILNLVRKRDRCNTVRNSLSPKHLNAGTHMQIYPLKRETHPHITRKFSFYLKENTHLHYKDHLVSAA